MLKNFNLKLKHENENVSSVLWIEMGLANPTSIFIWDIKHSPNTFS